MTGRRKFRSTPFVAVPVWVIRRLADRRAPSSCLAVYVVLRSYANNDTDAAWPSRQRVGDDAGGLSVATVKRSIATLVDVGAVVRDGQDRRPSNGAWSTQHLWLPTDEPVD